MRLPTVSIDRTYPSGAWLCSAFVNPHNRGEYLHSETFYGYNKRDALAMFRKSIRDLYGCEASS